MRLAVISHKVCWSQSGSPSGYETDGGFPRQMQAISELFSETRLVVPCESRPRKRGNSHLTGKNMRVHPLPVPKGKDFVRKLALFGWLLTNGKTIWREIKQADAVHAPIPGDVGTIGILFALLQKKPLFVRYCGNWLVQKTLAERFWRLMIERLAGGRNVMLATGNAAQPPSKINKNVRWIFSTSLDRQKLAAAAPRRRKNTDAPKLIIVCRQESGKGTKTVLESLPMIQKRFVGATLEIVGDGSQLSELKKTARILGIEPQVTFHGQVSQAKVMELLAEADLFCFPTASEGFPKVVLEAIACGLPVITTPVSVLPELIGETGSGMILDDPAAENLACAVIQIYENDELYHQMSENAVRTAKQYSLEKWRDTIGEYLCESWNVQSLSE